MRPNGKDKQRQRETQFANKLLNNDNVMIKHRGYAVCVYIRGSVFHWHLKLNLLLISPLVGTLTLCCLVCVCVKGQLWWHKA